MRENRLHGSEGGAANARPYPYLNKATLTEPWERECHVKFLPLSELSREERLEEDH